MQFWFHHYTRMSGIISENLESKQFPFFQILTNNHSRDNFHFSILVKLFPTQHLPALALVGFLARQVLFRGSQLPQWLETEYLSPLFKPDFSSWKQSICLLHFSRSPDFELFANANFGESYILGSVEVLSHRNNRTKVVLKICAKRF